MSTEQEETRPRTKVKDLLARLPETEHLSLANAVGGGLHDARLAAQCLTDPDPQTQDVVQLLGYIGRSIQHLETARRILVRGIEETDS